MNIKELGALIKSRRESKNLSLEDVAQGTKIPLKSLISIEEGDLSFIGYETYYKNFLKCYVLYLGLTYDEYQDLIAQTEDFTNQNEPPKSLETQRAESQPEMTKPRGKKLAIQLIILAVIGGGAYFYFMQENKEDTFFQETIVEEPKKEVQEKIKEDVVEKQVKQETSVEQQEEINKEAEQEVKQEELVQQKLEEVDQSTKDEKIKEEVKKEDEKAEQDKKEEKKDEELDTVALIKKYPSAKVINWDIVSKPKKGEQQAVMYAKQDCWMQYEHDGVKSHFTLKRGTQREFIFKRELKFKIANGSAITLFHNRKPVEIGDSTKMREVNLK